jgi:iron(III) transport system substrate-binding protein
MFIHSRLAGKQRLSQWFIARSRKLNACPVGESVRSKEVRRRAVRMRRGEICADEDAIVPLWKRQSAADKTGGDKMARLAWTAVLAFMASLTGGSAYAADAATIAAAKKEGEVVWYSTQIISQLVRPVTAAFEKKYPGIKVRATRANAAEVAVKIFNESKAGNVQVDVFDGTTTVVPLKKEGYVLKWLPEPAKEYPADLKDPEGYWIANNLFIITPGYNTSLVKPGTEPKTYQDLLDPKWRGKMAWNGFPTSSGMGGFVGTVLTEMGEEKGKAYLRELAKQNIAPVRGSAREVLDQVIAGEYQVALQIFNHHAVISAKKGAPVDWIKMEPATGTLSVLSIHKSAPHPNAAKLLSEFIISKEGQEVFAKANYITAHPQVPAAVPTLKPAEGHFRVRFFTPEQTQERMPHWKQVSDEIFR